MTLLHPLVFGVFPEDTEADSVLSEQLKVLQVSGAHRVAGQLCGLDGHSPRCCCGVCVCVASCHSFCRMTTCKSRSTAAMRCAAHSVTGRCCVMGRLSACATAGEGGCNTAFCAPCCPRQVAMLIAQSELAKINTFKTPEDKLQCVQATFQFVASAITATSRDTKPFGMHSVRFLPVCVAVCVAVCVLNFGSFKSLVTSHGIRLPVLPRCG